MKIFRAPKQYDLFLTHSWVSVRHGICGHTFEVIDYYLFLKDNTSIKVGMLFTEYKHFQDFQKDLDIILEKYNLTEIEKHNLLLDTFIEYQPVIYKGNFLFTDGSKAIADYTIFGKSFTFLCGFKPTKTYFGKTITLGDSRIYDYYTIDYKKKIYFRRYKKPQHIPKGKGTLLYVTENCRDYQYDDGIYVDNPIILRKKDLPKKDFFSFEKYFYTPIERKFDCSPRLLAECKYYNKEVIFHPKVLKYMEEDKGLSARMYDINNDFMSIHLLPDDDIIDILKNNLK